MHKLKFKRRTIDITVPSEFLLNIKLIKHLIEHAFFHTKSLSNYISIIAIRLLRY